MRTIKFKQLLNPEKLAADITKQTGNLKIKAQSPQT